nr:DNA gyrase inhibitor YacG [uncultured Cohaesibacter sp.]
MTSEQDKNGKPKGGAVKGLRRARPCPICSKPSTKESYPFCSERCRQVDLSRWLSGVYAIPASEEDDPDESDFDQQD